MANEHGIDGRQPFMIIVAGRARFDPADVEEVRADIREIEAITRAEDGCLSYAMAFDDPQAGELVILEQWRDDEALDAHLHSEALQRFQERNVPRAHEFSIKRYRVTDARPVGEESL